MLPGATGIQRLKSRGVDLGTASNQDFGNFGMPLPSGRVQRGPTIEVPCINVCTCGEQGLGELHVPFSSCCVQWSPAVNVLRVDTELQRRARCWRIPRVPSPAALCSGVQPVSSCALASPPAASSTSATLIRPCHAAVCNGIQPSRAWGLTKGSGGEQGVGDLCMSFSSGPVQRGPARVVLCVGIAPLQRAAPR